MLIEMRRLFLSVLAVMIALPHPSQAKKKISEELKVMSYNIRMGTAKDGTNSWQFRAPATIEMLDDQKPDVFGVQEAFDFQLAFIKEFCKDYKCVGVGREDGKKEGEHMSVFWNKKTVKLVKWGTFWLSETPEVPSMGWDAKCFRTATWALMKDKKTGKKFYFVNTHLDHRGKEAQKNGLKLIVDRIDSINSEGYPMVLTGDFNIRPDNPALKELDARMQSARKVATVTDTHNTFNGWSVKPTSSIIDYIYINGFASCLQYRTVTDKYADKPFVSDHYPIFARLVL